MKRWWNCWKRGHQIRIYGPTIVPNKVVARCDCGHGLRPQLVYIESLDAL